METHTIVFGNGGEDSSTRQRTLVGDMGNLVARVSRALCLSLSCIRRDFV